MAIYTTTPTQTAGNAHIESRDDYAKSPQGQWNYWRDELKGSQEMLKRWHKQADQIHKRYVDQRTNESTLSSDERASMGGKSKLNLFYSNVQTVYSMLYGRLPRIDVKRQYSDAKDDVGRVASVIMQRLLNNDMADNPTQYESVLQAVLLDRLVPGLGTARVRYEVETGMRDVAEVRDIEGNVITPATQEKTVLSESTPTDYFHWRDVLWSWCRTPADMRWMAFRTWITKDEAKKRYGEKVAEELDYKQQKMLNDEDNTATADDPANNDYWMKAEIWEIWDKTSRRVIEFHFMYDKLLSSKPDPLKLAGFFPAPPFLIANPTTSLYKPTPDWHLAQDLYIEIDKLQTRIAIITEAVKVVGVYDDSIPEIQRMFKEGTDNDLIPTSSWHTFAEKGGLKGCVDWFPIEDVVNALLNLRQLRDENIELLYQVTGMADIMRGQLANQYEGVGQSEEKVKFGSVRVQQLQQSFAKFVSNLMAIKAEIISREFDEETIIKLSNAEYLNEDPQLVSQAVALIKQPEIARLRVSVKAESLAAADYQRMQEERGRFLEGLSTFLTASAPLIEAEPATKPFLLEMLQWGLAGFRGSDEIEGILDRAIEGTKQAAQQQQDKPDPELQKLQIQLQLEQTKGQNQIAAIQAKTQSEMQLRQADMFADIQTKNQEHQNKMAETEADLMKEAAVIRMKGQMDMQVETVTSRVNAEQHAEGVEAEMNKDIVGHRMKLEEIEAGAAAKIRESRVSAEVKDIPKQESSDG